jgi:hypothetical protein
MGASEAVEPRFESSMGLEAMLLPFCITSKAGRNPIPNGLLHLAQRHVSLTRLFDERRVMTDRENGNPRQSSLLGEIWRRYLKQSSAQETPRNWLLWILILGTIPLLILIRDR